LFETYFDEISFVMELVEDDAKYEASIYRYEKVTDERSYKNMTEGNEVAQKCDSLWNMMKKKLSCRDKVPLQRRIVDTMGFLKYNPRKYHMSNFRRRPDSD